MSERGASVKSMTSAALRALGAGAGAKERSVGRATGMSERIRSLSFYLYRFNRSFVEGLLRERDVIYVSGSY